jgi:hypothetical protein
MRDPFLRPNERNDLRERIEVEPKSTLHPRGYGLAVRDEAESEAVAVHRGLARGARECIDRRGWRREVRVPRSEVDDVDATRKQLTLLARNVRKRVLGKALEPRSESGH